MMMMMMMKTMMKTMKTIMKMMKMKPCHRPSCCPRGPAEHEHKEEDE